MIKIMKKKTLMGSGNMHKISKEIVILTAVLFVLSGCVSTTKTVIAHYDTSINYHYPEVSIFYDNPSEQLTNKCQLFADGSTFNHCYVNEIDTPLYQRSFEDSKLFKNVLLADESTEYSITIATTNLDRETASELSMAVLSGASLLLLPMINEQNINVEVSIFWKNIEIKQYNYQLAHTAKLSLFNKQKAADQSFANSVVSHIISDIQKDNVLTVSFLTAFLESSDYEKDLITPQKISNFESVEQFLYNNPLLGTVITYANPEFHSDKIDLYVYPIRHVKLDNQAALLARESQNIKTEFDAIAKQLEWTNINFSTIKPLEITGNDYAIKGIYFEGDYQPKLGEKSFTSVYLFKLKDKFVKFRTSFPERYITKYIKEIIPQITVPDESIFMKKLRHPKQT